MPTEDTLVSVPLGGGLDASREPYLLEPPALLVARNVRLSTLGAVEKRPGAELVGNTGIGTQGVVAAPRKGRHGEEEAVFYGSASGVAYSRDEGIRALDYGALVPAEVIVHEALAPRGAIVSSNVAHIDGYTAVIASVAYDSTRVSTANHDMIVAQCVILGPDWSPVWGPYEVPQLQLCPRVEPYEDGTSAGFIWLGLRSHPSATVNEAFGSPLLLMHAFHTRLTTLAAAPATPSTIDTNVYGWPHGHSTTRHTVYDSHGAGAASAYVVYYSDPTTGDGQADIVVRSLTPSTGTAVTSVDYVISAGRDAFGDLTVLHDTDSASVLVASSERERIYSLNAALSAVDDAPYGAINDRPVLYRAQSGAIYLTNRLVFLTGSAPATPSLGGAASATRPLHRRPQPHDGRGNVYYSHYTRVLGSPIHKVAGGQELRVLDFDESTQRQHTLVQLNWNRLPAQEYRDTFHAKGNATNGYVGEVGQMAVTADGSVLVPQQVAHAVYLADQTETKWTTENAFLGGPSSLIDDQTRVVVTEVRFATVPSRYTDHYGSSLVAAGNLHAFDGVCSFEPCPEAPGTGTGAEVTALQLSATIAGATAVEIPPDHRVAARGCMVFVDRNGVKYRGPVFELKFEENTGESPITWRPCFVIGMQPSHLPQQFTGGGWKLEVYRTSPYEIGAELLDNAGPFFWVATCPIVQDTNGTFIADASNWLSDTVITAQVAPYTESELENTRPPALQTIVRSGQYLFGLSQENPYEVWHTKPLSDFIGPEFNPNLIVYAPPDSGGVVSLASTASQIYLLCRNGIWTLYTSAGPDGAGVGTFREFQKIWDGDGAITDRWTLSTPHGVVFLARSGPKLLEPGSDRVLDIGRQVRGMVNAADVVCSVYDPVLREAWLFHSGVTDSYDSALVYSFDAEAWTTCSFEASASMMLGERMLRVRPDASLVLHGETQARDGTDAYTARIETPWLRYGHTQAYLRVKRVAALLRRVAGTTGRLRIRTAVDYVDTTIDDREWTAPEVEALSRGAQLVVRCARQKVDAIKITVTDETVLVGDEQNEIADNDLRWSLVGLTTRVGAKRGEIKLQQEAKK